jgi:hypothetical protein
MARDREGLDIWLREYKRGVKQNLVTDDVWPCDLRALYNSVQINQNYVSRCPKTFLGGIEHYFPLLCR